MCSPPPTATPISTQPTDLSYASCVAVPHRFANVVVLGKFNPAIFHADWFRKHDVLPAFEVAPMLTQEPPTREVIDVGGPGALFISNEVASLAFRSTRLDVDRDRFSFASDRPDWTPDLGGYVASFFAKLPETPVSALGFNILDHRPVAGGVNVPTLLSRWLPLDALAKIAGDQARPGATVVAAWKDFQLRLTLEKSIVLENAVFVGQNYEVKVKTVDQLRQILLRWPEVVAHADEVATRILAGPQ